LNGLELVGRPAIYRGEVPGACFQNTLIRFRPSHLVLPEFALIVFRAYMRTGRFRREAQQTTNIAHLSLGRLAEIEFPLPPIPEQRRIIAKVDQLMALCDELEARQARKREVGARLTTSVLKALASAEGPEEFERAWGRVKANFDLLVDRVEKVEALRKALLQLAVSGALSSEPTTSWKQGTVADVADCRLGKMLDKTKNRGTPRFYLRNTNVHWFRLDLRDIKKMPFEDRECAEYELQSGDLVVCEGGHGIGRTAIWNEEIKPIMFQKALHRLRPRATIDSRFLAYQLKTAHDTGVMSQYFTGAGIPHLTGRKLAMMKVNIPPLVEQQRIVVKVEQLMKLCNDLEARLRRAEQKASELAEAVVRELVG
jgi:type I restriction enzyme, S subunit